MRSSCVTVAAVGLLAVSIPACGSGTTSGPGKSAGGKPRVAVVTNVTDPFWSHAEAGAMKAAKDFDADVTFRQPAKSEAAEQNKIVRDLIRTGLDGIAVSVINPKDQTEEFQGVAGKIHFVTMDNDAEATGRKCYIGTDNYEAGLAAGKLVKQAMPAGGTVVLAVGTMSSLNAQQRSQGVMDELAGSKNAKGPTLGKYTLYKNEPVTDDNNQSKALTRAKDTLEDLKNTTDVCLVGLYAYNPPAFLEAARSRGVVDKVKIVAFDENPITLEGIEKGEIVGTVVQDPFMFGYKSVEVLAALTRGDESKLVKAPVPHRYVTKDGGPETKQGEMTVVNLKAADFKKMLADNLASVKK